MKKTSEIIKNKYELPKDYLDFMKDKEDYILKDGIILWSIDKIEKINKEYNTSEFFPGLIYFGSNGGDEAFAFDFREEKSIKIVSIPYIGKIEDAIEISSSFSVFIKRINNDSKIYDDFNYNGCEYSLETNRYILVISEDIFDDETVNYANNLIFKIFKNYDNFLDKLLEIDLKNIYGNKYTDDEIKEKIGRPEIEIIFKKDGEHPHWKFKYSGIINFNENQLDEHILSIEFSDDLNLDNYIQMNG